MLAANLVAVLVMRHESAQTLTTMEQVIDRKLAVCAASSADYALAPVADLVYVAPQGEKLG